MERHGAHRLGSCASQAGTSPEHYAILARSSAGEGQESSRCARARSPREPSSTPRWQSAAGDSAGVAHGGAHQNLSQRQETRQGLLRAGVARSSRKPRHLRGGAFVVIQGGRQPDHRSGDGAHCRHGDAEHGLFVGELESEGCRRTRGARGRLVTPVAAEHALRAPRAFKRERWVLEVHRSSLVQGPAYRWGVGSLGDVGLGRVGGSKSAKPPACALPLGVKAHALTAASSGCRRRGSSARGRWSTPRARTDS